MALTILNGPIIEEGQSLSDVLDCTGGHLVRVTMPADWTYAPLTFQSSSDGEFFNDLMGMDGKEITVQVVPGTGFVLSPDFTISLAYIKFRSGTRNAPVVQKERREFAVALATADSSRSGGTMIGGQATFADGSQAVVLPDWYKVAFDTADGLAATLEGDDLRINQGGTSRVQARVRVTHNYGSYVVFGYAWDGGEVTELGRVKIDSNDPILVAYEKAIPLEQGGLLSIYISSNFEWQNFAWIDGEVLLAVEV